MMNSYLLELNISGRYVSFVIFADDLKTARYKEKRIMSIFPKEKILSKSLILFSDHQLEGIVS